MSKYKKIIVALDLTGNASVVLERAARIASLDKAELIIVNACYHTVPMYVGGVAGSLYANNKFYVDEKSIRKELKSELIELLEEARVPTDQIKIEFGRPSDVILRAAKQYDADVIVLGSHGTHGVSFLLGSTANAVLHRATCDVLAVRIYEDDE